MTNLKDENKRQSNNIKEDTNEFLDNQRQQLENTTSAISEIQHLLFQKQQIGSIIISMNIKDQIMKFLIRALISQTNINNKPLTQSKQFQITILNYKITFLILINQYYPD